MPRKPKPLPIPDLPDSKRRFDTLVTALLSVKKEELRQIDTKLDDVRKELERRKRKSKGQSSS